MISSRLLVASLATLSVLAGTTAAFAAPNAVADADSSLRKNPKTSSQKVNFVEEGDLLTITQCQGSWCFAKVPGPDGWIKKNVLVPIDDEGEVVEDAPFNFGITIGPGGPSISIGGGPAPGPSPGPSGGPRACFFADIGYTGGSFCVAAGDSVANVGPGWNDRISSIRVYGGATAQACQDDNFSGSCNTFGNTPNIGAGWNDQISSVTVY